MQEEVAKDFKSLAYGSDVVPISAEQSEQERLAEYINDSIYTFDWNERWQKVLSKTDQVDEHERIVLLEKLSKEFSEAATRVCVQIVEELFESHKNVTPISSAVGGIAGGMKFLCDGIFVKLASRDWKNIYGGDQFSIKAASCELLAMTSYLDLRWNLICCLFHLFKRVSFVGSQVCMFR